MKGNSPTLLSAAFAGLLLLPAEAEDKAVSFKKEIKPILRERCVHCHNRKTLTEQVSFETAELAFTKNSQGQSIIVPGKPEESLMITALESSRVHEKAMPQTGVRPSEEEIGKLRVWILEGAEWPRGFAGRIRPTFIPTE